MNERPKIKIEEGKSIEISYFQNSEGVVTYRKLLIAGAETSYMIQVGTPEYVWSIRERNMGITDPELKEDENILPMITVSSFEAVMQSLSQIPPENLEPYLEKLENPDPAA